MKQLLIEVIIIVLLVLGFEHINWKGFEVKDYILVGALTVAFVLLIVESKKK